MANLCSIASSNNRICVHALDGTFVRAFGADGDFNRPCGLVVVGGRLVGRRVGGGVGGGGWVLQLLPSLQVHTKYGDCEILSTP